MQSRAAKVTNLRNCAGYLFVILCNSAVNAQPPVYNFIQEFQITLPDTQRQQYFLININQDSISDLICATYDSVWAFDGANGTPLIDPIPTYRRNFVMTPYMDFDNTIDLYFAYSDTSYLLFRIVHYPLFTPSDVDTFFIAISPPSYGWFTGLSCIFPFDVGGDSAEDFILFFNHMYHEMTIGDYFEGSFAIFDFNGNLIRDTTPRKRYIKISPFMLNGSRVFSILEYSAFSSNSGYYCSDVDIATLNDSLIEIDSDNVAGGSFKHLKNGAGSIEYLLQYYDFDVSVYDNPFLNGGISRSFPCGAIPAFYHIANSLYILTGCPNSYFELRDLEWNLLAFVWGPNIAISDAEALDVDRDGTDELLCRTADGFVLYRLDTTAVDIAHDDALMPKIASLSAYPNPFNSSVTISLGGFSGLTDIAVYDIAGRLVRRIEAVGGRAVWDGRDANGLAVESGLYFVRAAGGKGKASTKIVLLK
jgi:hypothetical protein